MKKFNRLTSACGLFFLCLMNAACNLSSQTTSLTADKNNSASMPSIEKHWQLTHLLTTSGMSPAYTGATLVLQQGNVSGHGTCNNYFGSYRLTGQQLNINLAGSTRMACAEPERMTQEQRYFELLSKVVSYQIVTKKLQLSDAQGKPLLLFSSQQ